jgi:hypothetical protein
LVQGFWWHQHQAGPGAAAAPNKRCRRVENPPAAGTCLAIRPASSCLCPLACTALHCTALHCTALHCTVCVSAGGRPCFSPGGSRSARPVAATGGSQGSVAATGGSQGSVAATGGSQGSVAHRDRWLPPVAHTGKDCFRHLSYIWSIIASSVLICPL